MLSADSRYRQASGNPTRTSAGHTPGEGNGSSQAIIEAIRASDLTHKIRRDLPLISDLSQERIQQGRKCLPGRRVCLRKCRERKNSVSGKPLAD